MLIKCFWKSAFLSFWWITFKARELRRKNHPLFVDLNEMHQLTKFHADRRSLKGWKINIFSHFEFINTSKNFEKQHFGRFFFYEICHTYRIEGALWNDAKIIQTEYCFQGHTQGQKWRPWGWPWDWPWKQYPIGMILKSFNRAPPIL